MGTPIRLSKTVILTRPLHSDNSMTTIRDFRLKPEDFNFVGVGLSRPECIIAERNGTLWASDDKSAVMRIDPNGTQTRVGTVGGLPNGLAMNRNGELFIANIGDGKLYQQMRTGEHRILLDQFEGQPLGSLNFVYVDDRDRMWMTVSTVTVPRINAVNTPIPDGFILMNDGSGWRKVGAGYHFTNEVRVDPKGTTLYVAETALGRVSRHTIAADGSLGPREIHGPETVFPGAKIDGITLDAEGNLWVTEVAKNSIVVITPDGHSHVVFSDPGATLLNMPASIAFAGPDLKTAYVGSLKMDRIATFRSPIAGQPMCHW